MQADANNSAAWNGVHRSWMTPSRHPFSDLLRFAFEPCTEAPCEMHVLCFEDQGCLQFHIFTSFRWLLSRRARDNPEKILIFLAVLVACCRFPLLLGVHFRDHHPTYLQHHRVAFAKRGCLRNVPMAGESLPLRSRCLDVNGLVPLRSVNVSSLKEEGFIQGFNRSHSPL